MTPEQQERAKKIVLYGVVPFLGAMVLKNQNRRIRDGLVHMSIWGEEQITLLVDVYRKGAKDLRLAGSLYRNSQSGEYEDFEAIDREYRDEDMISMEEAVKEATTDDNNPLQTP